MANDNSAGGFNKSQPPATTDANRLVAQLTDEIAALSDRLDTLVHGQAKLTELLERSLADEFVVARRSAAIDLTRSDEGRDSADAAPRRRRSKTLFGSGPLPSTD